ncbi:MAG: hypothetical protein K2L24_01265, partial [Opitutales bacterium]|nr:hypothetical protein [Opitutales bacterium]
MKGKKFEYCKVRDIAMKTETDEGPTEKAYVKSFKQTCEKIQEQIDELYAKDLAEAREGLRMESQMYASFFQETLDGELIAKSIVDKLAEYAGATSEVETVARQEVATYDLNDELGNLALQNHPNYKKQYIESLQEEFDDYTKRSTISQDEGWKAYYRGVRDELVEWKVSSDDQNIFEQRLASAKQLIIDEFGDLVPPDDFFGGVLAQVVGKIVASLKVNADLMDKEKAYELCYVKLQAIADSLLTLKESWDVEDSESTNLPEAMTALKDRVVMIAEDLNAITSEYCKAIASEVSLFNRITILEYIFNNYGVIDDRVNFTGYKLDNVTNTYQDSAGDITLHAKEINCWFTQSTDTGEDLLCVLDKTNEIDMGNGKTVPRRILFRYNNAKMRLEKSVIGADFGENVTDFPKVVEELTWVAARRETDAEEWSASGFLFKDVIRHNLFQQLLRYKADIKDPSTNKVIGEETKIGYLLGMAQKQLEADDYVRAYIEQAAKNLLIPIYRVQDSLLFFNGGDLESPAIVEQLSTTTPVLPKIPETTGSVDQLAGVKYLNSSTVTNPSMMHQSGDITNAPSTFPVDVKALEATDKVQLGEMVSYLLETTMKSSGNQDISLAQVKNGVTTQKTFAAHASEVTTAINNCFTASHIEERMIGKARSFENASYGGYGKGKYKVGSYKKRKGSIPDDSAAANKKRRKEFTKNVENLLVWNPTLIPGCPYRETQKVDGVDKSVVIIKPFTVSLVGQRYPEHHSGDDGIDYIPNNGSQVVEATYGNIDPDNNNDRFGFDLGKGDDTFSLQHDGGHNSPHGTPIQYLADAIYDFHFWDDLMKNAKPEGRFVSIDPKGTKGTKYTLKQIYDNCKTCSTGLWAKCVEFLSTENSGKDHVYGCWGWGDRLSEDGCRYSPKNTNDGGSEDHTACKNARNKMKKTVDTTVGKMKEIYGDLTLRVGALRDCANYLDKISINTVGIDGIQNDVNTLLGRNWTTYFTGTAKTQYAEVSEPTTSGNSTATQIKSDYYNEFVPEATRNNFATWRADYNACRNALNILGDATN